MKKKALLLLGLALALNACANQPSESSQESLASSAAFAGGTYTASAEGFNKEVCNVVKHM